MSIEQFPLHLVLAGPTASGKTAGALAIASRFPVEIISVVLDREPAGNRQRSGCFT